MSSWKKPSSSDSVDRDTCSESLWWPRLSGDRGCPGLSWLDVPVPSKGLVMATVIQQTKRHIYSGLKHLVVKGPTCQSRCKRHRFDPWVGKIPWRREWLPTAVSMPGESHGRRSLVGYRPWGCKGSDTTEHTHTHTHTQRREWLLRELAGSPDRQTMEGRSPCTPVTTFHHISGARIVRYIDSVWTSKKNNLAN